MNAAQQEIALDFQKLYYEQRDHTWNTTRWLGVHLKKCPMDLWTYQELIYDLKPDLIVETGTFRGGSAFFFATILDMVGHGEIMTIDIKERPRRPIHPRITYLTGSSTADDILAQVQDRSRGKQTIMIVLDADHAEHHVSRELELYSPFVSPGSYLVIEDTNVNGHPAFPDHGPGPMEAVQRFLATTDEFEVDLTRERHLISFNPNGWLKRRGGSPPSPAPETADRERVRAARRAMRRKERLNQATL